MYSFWRIWCDAHTQPKAFKLYNRVIDALEREVTLHSIEPYSKINGFVIDFELPLNSEAWNDAVVEVIELGQHFAVGWQLFGTIQHDLDAISNQTSITGVVMAQWFLRRDRAQWEESSGDVTD